MKRGKLDLFKKENLIVGVTIGMILLVIFFSTYQPGSHQVLKRYS